MRKRKIRVFARKKDAGQGPNFDGINLFPAEAAGQLRHQCRHALALAA